MELLFIWIISTVITFLITPLGISFAKRFKLLDDASVRFHPAHTHTGVIPRAGGISLLLGITITTLIYLPLSFQLVCILGSSWILVIIGIIDDYKDVNPYIRLLCNACIALGITLCGVTIPFITNPITGGIIRFNIPTISFSIFSSPYIIYPVAILFAFLWIMWTMHIVGWSAGVDGQMPGFVSISSFVLGILSMRYSIIDTSLHWITVLAFTTSGAFAGFIPWNFFPQKVMPGYSGKILAGFLLAILSILSFGKLGTALLVLGIPTIDAIYTLIRRWKKNTPLVSADRGHLHHLLLDIGWGKRRIALFYWIVSAILGLIALSVTSTQKLFALLLVLVCISGIILWLNLYLRSLKQHDQDNG
jgi:UDP-GlcNAc:undecaprenyl-phosphate/decaprenyl-phosphate GlcNAc-1-phosphate transferase